MQIGCAKSKVVINKSGQMLFGYGKMDQVTDGAETDLFARAFILKHERELLVFVNLESGFVSHHLKLAIVKQINQNGSIDLSMDNFLLCAQHTHAAPGGHSHYAALNITTKGFKPEVFESYKNACVDAITNAYKDLEQGKIFLNASAFEEDIDVAFNRSFDAYTQNKDAIELDDSQTHLAVDRMMKQLRFVNSEGNNKGVINFFGVQANSIGENNTKIHSDNKGYASSLLENDQTELKPFVAAFCSEASADVSPNYHGRGKWWPRGKYEDAFKSAYFNGFLQFELAKKLIETEELQIPINNRLKSSLIYVDFSSVDCDPEYTIDNLTHETGEATIGLSFLQGTEIDSPGIDGVSATLLNLVSTLLQLYRKLPVLNSLRKRTIQKRLYLAHGNKKILIELQSKKILGFNKLNKLPLLNVFTEVMEELKKQYKNGALIEHTWSPVILPIQLFIIGEIAIAAFPGDISTKAGERLRKSILQNLENQGILDVIITSYSNEYFGYCTTEEEYDLQKFEGGFTTFGKYTLAAFQTTFKKLSKSIFNSNQQKNTSKKLQPPEFSENELSKRTFKKL
jgi:neutral ceramidase